MKALILAAGLGTRLAPITNDRPKSLVPVNGTPILFKQIQNLISNRISDITVISGYYSDVLKQAVHASFPDVHIIESVDYATTNNMYSAYLSRDIMKGHDFLMMNADVFFDESVIRSLLLFEGENAIVTDIGTYMEESMKVIGSPDHIIGISKTYLPHEAIGTSIDVYKFSAAAGEAFFEKCREYIEEKNELKKWSEVALNDILNDVVFRACPLDGRWFEIDNHIDLHAAEKLFSN